MSVTNRRAIRRALEAPLKQALVDAGVCLNPDGSCNVQFANTVLDTRGVAEYVRFTVHFAAPRVLGMGTDGLTQDMGLAIAAIYTKAGTSADRNDTIAGIIETAYPYNAQLTFDGVTVILAETQPVDGVGEGSWWMSQIKVVWNRWRNQ